MTETPTEKTKSAKRTLIFLAVVMMINALSYGTIIPLFYPFAERFGLGALGVSMLFASFSLAQFIATPMIGKLSDKYGRRPALLLSLLGTAFSLALFGAARSVTMLFVARILDGITGGNNSVAQAVISDSVPPKDRAKAFGILGASFGVGFLLGPALGGILSQYSISLPFYVAGFLALVSVIAGYFILPETLDPAHRHKVHTNPIDPRVMLKIATRSGVGDILLASFVVSVSLNAFILTFQSFTNETLDLSPRDIDLLFTMVGFFGIIMQAAGVSWLLKQFGKRSKLIFTAELLSALLLGLMTMTFAREIIPFVVLLAFFQITSAPLGPLIIGMLSEKVEGHEQGEVMGVNQSFMSVAQIIGPLLTGLVITFNVSYGFVIAGSLMLVALYVSRNGYQRARLVAVK